MIVREGWCGRPEWHDGDCAPEPTHGDLAELGLRCRLADGHSGAHDVEELPRMPGPPRPT